MVPNVMGMAAALQSAAVDLERNLKNRKTTKMDSDSDSKEREDTAMDTGGPLSNMANIEMSGNRLSEDIAIMFAFLRKHIPIQLTNQRINVIVDRRARFVQDNSAMIYVDHQPVYGHSENTETTKTSSDDHECDLFKVYKRPMNDESDNETVPDSETLDAVLLKVNKRPMDDDSDAETERSHFDETKEAEMNELQNQEREVLKEETRSKVIVETEDESHSVPMELSILSMNLSPSIPKLTRSENESPYLFHLNLFALDGRQCLAYFVRNGSCIRFFPEIMMDVWRHLFFYDAAYLRDIAYHHQFRHSFALPLHDDLFTEIYYAVHRVQFCSVNYYRPRIEHDDELMGKSTTDDIKVDDDAKLQEFQSLCNEESSDDFKTCAAIKRICFLLSMQQQFDELLCIATECGYDTVNLMDDTHHLFQSHRFLMDNATINKIRDWLLTEQMIKKCTAESPDDCASMIRHCRKDRRPGGRYLENGMRDSHSSRADILRQTWLGILDKIHCPLFHGKSTDFRRTFERQRVPKRRQMLSFVQSSRLNLIKHDDESVDDKEDTDSFPRLQFGVSVDEWLPNGTNPKFKSMEEEVLHNSFVKVDPETLEQLKYESERRYRSTANDQHLNFDELLALKLFTDLDDLQKQVQCVCF